MAAASSLDIAQSKVAAAVRFYNKGGLLSTFDIRALLEEIERLLALAQNERKEGQ